MMPVVILCGGKGTRLGAETAETPKSLVDVAGRPFLEHQFNVLGAAGYRTVVLLVGHFGDRFSRLNGGAGLFDIVVADDGAVPLGTAGAVRHALPMVGDCFFVLYGDSYLECDYAAIEAEFRASGKSGLLTE